mgnify:CR=1 FL=1
MPIKKRSSRPVETEPQPQKLEITEGVKKPILDESRIKAVAGTSEPTAAQIRHTGAVAASVEKETGELLTPSDRVLAMRTPYDANNPQEQRYRNRVRNRGTAITAMCIVCTGSRKAVTECIATTCPLWAFRMGGDPFFGRK